MSIPSIRSHALDLRLTRQIAFLQAASTRLDEMGEVLTDLSDLNALRTYKRELEDYLAVQAAKASCPADPLSFVLGELACATETVLDAQRVYERCTSPLTGLRGTNNCSRQRLEEIYRELDHVQTELPKMLDALASRLHPEDWEPKGERRAQPARDLVATAGLMQPQSPLLQSELASNLYDFIHGQGPLYHEALCALADGHAEVARLVAEHTHHSNLLMAAEAAVAKGNHETAEKLCPSEHLFADLPYNEVEETVANLNSKLNEVLRLGERLEKTGCARDWSASFDRLGSFAHRVASTIADQAATEINRWRKILAELRDTASRFPGSEFRAAVESAARVAEDFLSNLETKTVTRYRRGARTKRITMLATASLVVVLAAIMLHLILRSQAQVKLLVTVDGQDWASAFPDPPRLLVDGQPLKPVAVAKPTVMTWLKGGDNDFRGKTASVAPESRFAPIGFRTFWPRGHVLVLDDNRFKPFRREVLDPYCREVPVSIGLTFARGTVLLTSDPLNVDVFDGGALLGKTPVRLTEVRGGDVVYSLRSKNLGDTIVRGTLADAQTLELHHRFPRGTIEITSDPPGAEVLNGTALLGNTPLRLIEVRPGGVAYGLRLKSHGSTVVDGTVIDAETLKLQHRFPHGTIEITSNPSGAEVYDLSPSGSGVSLGETPLTVTDRPAGRVFLKLNLDGYASAMVEGSVMDRERLVLSHKFVADVPQVKANIPNPSGTVSVLGDDEIPAERDNQPLGASAIFKEFALSRIETRFEGIRIGTFGQEAKKQKSAQTVLITDGFQTYAIYHIADTPLTLWPPGADWLSLIGVVRRGAYSNVISRISFLAQDPRLVVVPIDPTRAERLGGKTHRIAPDPFKFSVAVLVGVNEDYYGECKFQIDLATPQYVKIDRSLFSGLFGKFNPSRGDLVLSKTGEVLGIMVNNEYCAVLGKITPIATLQCGDNLRGQQAWRVLAQMQNRVLGLPLKLQ